MASSLLLTPAPFLVMPGLDPGIHVSFTAFKDVDGRIKSRHDDR
jgi:hypothetical protein